MKEVEAAIARIEAANTTVNAVVVKDYERARKDAVEADAAVARGEQKPFLGESQEPARSLDASKLTNRSIPGRLIAL